MKRWTSSTQYKIWVIDGRVNSKKIRGYCIDEFKATITTFSTNRITFDRIQTALQDELDHERAELNGRPYDNYCRLLAE
ncbi:hypothetical protein LG329_18660 [Virgibacillus necropolis]|uniref:hypothetical protein n=1 Tax=Virgibacillus necropolis TaxID=163877 RepID=UPI00384BAAF1